jgi:hypothetical protein
MKKYLILIGIVAAMCSCSDNIYDNIREMVDSEIIYPAGYDQYYVKATGGVERVVIDLMATREENPYLPRAVRTVVEYGTERKVFEPARSWVNVTDITVAQVYKFKIYTEDKYGNPSKPVEINGKPYSDDEKNALMILNTVSSSASIAAINSITLPDLYTMSSVTASYTDGSNNKQVEEFYTPIFILSNLPIGATTKVNLTYHLLPISSVDMVDVVNVLEVKTISQEAFDEFLNETSPFKGPHILSAAAPCEIPAYDFDYGGEGKAFHDNDVISQGGTNGTYRVDNGDPEGAPVDTYIPYPWCVGWLVSGEWLIYTVEVVDAGDYSIEVAQCGGGGRHHIEVDRLNLSGTVSPPGAGADPNYSWLPSVAKVSLTAGKHKIKYHIESAPGNYYGLRFTKL